MPIQAKYLADFEENHIYHIYNRTNNKEPLFLSDENRLYFLRKYKEILSPFIGTYCWCLLPNHFHFLIKVNAEKEIVTRLKNKEPVDLTITERNFLKDRVAGLKQMGKPNVTLSELIEQTFKRFFQSYALSFNKYADRKGNLFYKPFKRVLIEKESQFTMAIVYVNANAAKHNLVKNFKDYTWSSWQSIISNLPTTLLRNEIIEWFGSMNECVKVHEQMAAFYFNCEIALGE